MIDPEGGRAVVPPRTPKGARSRERIMAAAARLFAEQGYDGTGVEAIARAAGITVPGMYKHFPTKAALLMEVARAANRSSPARRQLGEGPDLPGQLAALFAEYTAAGNEQPRRLSIELSRAATRNAELALAVADYNATLRRALARTLQGWPALAAAPDDAELTAHLLLVLLMGAIHIDTLDADLVGSKALVDFVAGHTAALLDTRPSAGSPAPVSPGMPSVSVEPAEDAADEPTDGRKRRASRTRQRILAAAAELFALRGYDATTTEDVAAGAGITVPGLYRHVRSKAELLSAVGRRSFASYQLARPLGEGDGADPVAELAAIACAFSAPGQRAARRLAIELDFGAWRQPELAADLRDYHRAVRGNVASTLGGGPDRQLAALVFLMLFMGIAHLDTVDPSLVGDPGWCDYLARVVPVLMRA